MNFRALLSNFFIATITLSTAIILLGAAYHPSFIHFGTLILLMTPITRVLFCSIYFIKKELYTLVGCTLFTLTLLILTFLGFFKV